MPRSRRTYSRTAGQLATLSQRAPGVVSRRLSRMTDGTASAADRREAQRMGTEKIDAFQEGWMAMASEMQVQQQRTWSKLWLSAGNPWNPEASVQWWMRSMVGADRVLAAGLRPMTRTVSENSRRLTRSRP